VTAIVNLVVGKDKTQTLASDKGHAEILNGVTKSNQSGD
jgi:hypothetical protein